MAAEALARLDENDAFIREAVQCLARGETCPSPPDGQVWAERAFEAGVLSPMAAALRRSGRTVPSGLASFELSVAARHLRTMRELAWVSSRLTAGDVPFAVLKGPVLRSVVFSDKHAREYADLDVLVSPAHLRQSLHLLVKDGATLGLCDWEGALLAETAEVSIRLPQGTTLDLHWSLINFGDIRAGYRLDTASLLERRVPREVEGQTVVTLADDDLVLHTMLHACLSGGSKLRWLLDVQQCVRWLSERSTPASLATRAHELGLVPAARAMLATTRRHLDPAVSPWEEAMGRASTWNWLLDAVSRSRPPSAPSLGPRGPYPFFIATRRSSARSWRALAWNNLGRVWNRNPTRELQRELCSLDDDRVQAWLARSEQAATGAGAAERGRR